jgi:hypothetical protein
MKDLLFLFDVSFNSIKRFLDSHVVIIRRLERGLSLEREMRNISGLVLGD